jgi:pyruvate/2-oxoglutarate dehydrogenase complex dihydrolipoamide dehydrogenase (E3) component
VELFEARAELGGNFLLGAIPPGKGELTSYLSWLGRELASLGVHIHLNTIATPETLAGGGYDVVVFATGAAHTRPDIAGLDNTNVMEACDVLAGHALPGARVVVAGGGEIGAETALYLATQGKQVVIVDALSGIALNEGMARRHYLLKELDQLKVAQLPNTTIIAIEDDGVQVTTEGLSHKLACDTVVLALGMSSVAPTENELAAATATGAEVHVVGDAREPADALAASRAGYALGISL